jgi:hypothetical protein
MSAVETAWQHMKNEARGLAVQGRSLTADQAQTIVRRIFTDSKVWTMPEQGTLEFWARELIRMVEENTLQLGGRQISR